MQWSDIGRIVGSAAPVVGTLLGGPAGGAVGGLVASWLGVDEPTPEKVGAAIKADPEAFAKLRAAELEHKAELERLAVQAETNRLEAETTQLVQINRTARAEAASNDAYVRRWRPTFGYAVALTWTATMAAAAYAIVATPTEAPAIIAALINLAPIWGVALAVLGVSVVKRSKDKEVAASAAPATGVDVLARAVDAVKGAIGR
jgi:hypothetical protein